MKNPNPVILGRLVTFQVWHVVGSCKLTMSVEQTQIICVSRNWLNTSLSFHMSNMHCDFRLSQTDQ